jgi:glucose/arabinose dehydrogenase
MAFAPAGRLFVCQQGGQLRVIKTGSLLSTPFVSLTVDSSGERGLLGIAFDPNFATNRYLYVYYTVATSPIHNRVSRFTAAGDTAVRVARQLSWNSTISAPPPTTMAARSHHRQQNRCDAGCPPRPWSFVAAIRYR